MIGGLRLKRILAGSDLIPHFAGRPSGRRDPHIGVASEAGGATFPRLTTDET
jgi:hypothetical protein